MSTHAPPEDFRETGSAALRAGAGQPLHARGDRERAPGSERAGSATGASDYLESDRIIVDGPSEEFEVCPVRCKCSFCPTCCLVQGLKLRERLIPIVSGWQSVFMITLTVDPSLFPDPEAAHRYVQGRRAISELVRALRKSGYLLGEHYFCAVEWQKRTGMAHYHLLVEAAFVPWELIRDLWNRNRPAHLDPPVGPRPGFGSVRYSQVKFRNGRHAACYATKYLLKHPEEGFPGWVLNYEGRIKRYLTSHGFWKSGSDEPCPAATTGQERKRPAGRPKGRVEQRTVRERVERCCRQAVIFRVARVADTTGALCEDREYFDRCWGSFDDVCRLLGLTEDSPPRRLRVDRSLALKLAVSRLPVDVRIPADGRGAPG